jgi:hypothetical protein
MKLPPFSGPALRALVAAAENPATGDALFDVLRKEAGIAAMLRVPLEADDEFPVDARPLAAPARGAEGAR